LSSQGTDANTCRRNPPIPSAGAFHPNRFRSFTRFPSAVKSLRSATIPLESTDASGNPADTSVVRPRQGDRIADAVSNRVRLDTSRGRTLRPLRSPSRVGPSRRRHGAACPRGEEKITSPPQRRQIDPPGVTPGQGEHPKRSHIFATGMLSIRPATATTSRGSGVFPGAETSSLCDARRSKDLAGTSIAPRRTVAGSAVASPPGHARRSAFRPILAPRPVGTETPESGPTPIAGPLRFLSLWCLAVTPATRRPRCRRWSACPGAARGTARTAGRRRSGRTTRR